MIFTAPDIAAFLALCGDTNPLHTSDEYAVAAGFDGRLVPGMLAVLTTIQNRQEPIYDLRAKFAEPLYCNIEYPFGFNLSGTRLWYGPGNQKRCVVWVNAKVLAKPFTATDEEHVGEYSTTEPVSWRNLVMYWVSWFTGTQLPGAGAILSHIEIDFLGDGNPITDGLAYAVRIAERHDNLGVIVLDGALRSGDLVAFCEIRAFFPMANPRLEIDIEPSE